MFSQQNGVNVANLLKPKFNFLPDTVEYLGFKVDAVGRLPPPPPIIKAKIPVLSFDHRN